MRARSALLVLLCALAPACSLPAEPGAGDPVGEWATPLEAISPTGTYEQLLTLSSGGRFVDEARMYGAYPGQPRNFLSAWSRTEGRYRAEDGRLHFEPESITTFDTFSGKGETTVQAPPPHRGVYEGAAFEVDGGRLTLTYTAYPADAPETTRRTFRRRDR